MPEAGLNATVAQSVRLTPKAQRFVAEYLVDLNATAAAIRAGYSPRTAGAIGAENLRKPQIAAAIQVAMREREARTGITQDRVLAELEPSGAAGVLLGVCKVIRSAPQNITPHGARPVE